MFPKRFLSPGRYKGFSEEKLQLRARSDVLGQAERHLPDEAGLRAPPAAGAGNRSGSRPALPPQRPVARETPRQLGSGVAAAAAAASAERPAQELGLLRAA